MSAYVTYEVRAIDVAGDSLFHTFVRAVAVTAEVVSDTLEALRDMWVENGDGPAEQIVNVTFERSIPARIGRPRRVVPARVL